MNTLMLVRSRTRGACAAALAICFIPTLLYTVWGMAGTQRNVPLARKYYAFHDGFWINLHHTLFREAVLTKMNDEARNGIGITPLPDAELSDDERKTWSAAVCYFVVTFGGRKLLRDGQLVRINDVLGQEQDPVKLETKALPEDFVNCLESAAPVYRRHWWPAHQQANEQFIAEMEPRVNEFAPVIIPQLERLFGMKWPAVPLQVDVTYYVAEIGNAYTTVQPGHTTIASSAERTHGLAGLEILFHEGAHTLTEKLESTLRTECRRQKKDCGDLWHAAQFYTVGEVAKKALDMRGMPDYVPYAYKFGLYERGTWAKFRPALERDWQPYLDGKTSFNEAIARLVRDIDVPGAAPAIQH